MDLNLKRINQNENLLAQVLETGDINTVQALTLKKAQSASDQTASDKTWADPQGSHYMNMEPLLANASSPLGFGRLELISTQAQKTTWVSQTVLSSGVHFLELYHPFRLKQVDVGLIKETKSSVKQNQFISIKFPTKSVVVRIDFEKNLLQVFHKESKTKHKLKFGKGRFRFAVRLWGIGNCLTVNPFYLNQSHSIAMFGNCDYLKNSFKSVFKMWKIVQDFDLEAIVRSEMESEMRQKLEKQEAEAREQQEAPKAGAVMEDIAEEKAKKSDKAGAEEKKEEKKEGAEGEKPEQTEEGDGKPDAKEGEAQEPEEKEETEEIEEVEEVEEIEETEDPKKVEVEKPIPAAAGQKIAKKITSKKIPKKKDQDKGKKAEEKKGKADDKKEAEKAEPEKKEAKPEVDAEELQRRVAQLLESKANLMTKMKTMFKIGKNAYLEISDFIFDRDAKVLAFQSEKSNIKILKENNKEFKFFQDKLMLYQILQKILLSGGSNPDTFLNPKWDQNLVSFLLKHSCKMLTKFSKISELNEQLQRIRGLVCDLLGQNVPEELRNVEQESVHSLSLSGSGNVLVIDPAHAMKVVPQKDEQRNLWNPFALSALDSKQAFFNLKLRELEMLFMKVLWEQIFDSFILENETSEHLLQLFQVLLTPGHSLVRGDRVFFRLPKLQLRGFIHILTEYLKQKQWLGEARTKRKVSLSVRKMTESDCFQQVEQSAPVEVVHSEEDDMGLANLFSPRRGDQPLEEPKDGQTREEPTTTVVPGLFKNLYPTNINGDIIPEKSDVIQSILIRIEEAIYMQSNFRMDNQPSTEADSDLRNRELENITRPHSGFHRLFSYLNSSLETKNFGSLVEAGFMSNSGFRTENNHFLGLRPGLRTEELLGKTEDISERSQGLNRHMAGLPNENISLLDGIRLLPPVRLSRPFECFSVDNCCDFLVSVDDQRRLGLWSTKFGLANLVTTSLCDPLIERKVEKLINYAIEKEKVNDRDFYGLNGENQRIVISKAAAKEPVKKAKPEQPKKVPTAKENAQIKAKEELIKKNIKDQLYQMGFNLGHIESAMEGCSGADLNPDVIIGKILQMKPETKTSKSKTSKMVLKPEWACHVCTFVNINSERTEGALDQCMMCFTPAGEDAFLTEIFIEEFEKTEEIMFANVAKQSKPKFDSSLRVETDPIEVLLKPDDQIRSVSIVEFARENLLNRFVVCVVLARGERNMCMLVRLGYTRDLISKTVFLNRFENKASSYLGHSFIPKGEEEAELGRLLAAEFRDQIHQVFPFVRQSELLEQTGRVMFELRHRPDDVKLVPLLHNRKSQKNGDLVSQKVAVGGASVDIDNFFVSDRDTVALVTRSSQSVHIYNIVNQASDFFKSDMQVDISSELEFESPVDWIQTDDQRLMLQYGSNALHLNLNESVLTSVSQLDPQTHRRFLQFDGERFVLESNEGQLVTQGICATDKTRAQTEEKAAADFSQKMIEQFAKPAQLLETLKNTSTVEFSVENSCSLLTYHSRASNLKSAYFHLVSTEQLSAASIHLSSPQKAMTVEVEVFARVDKTASLWKNLKEHLTSQYSKLPAPEVIKGNKNLEAGSVHGRLALKSTESQGGKHSSKHFISQVFQNDKESFLSQLKNSVLVFESVYDKRVKVNRILIECPKMWDLGYAAETGLVVFFEDLSQMQILGGLRELQDSHIWCLLKHLSLPHIFLSLEAGVENEFFLDKEMQGRYCAFIPLKYKSIERAKGEQLVITKFFLFGSLTNTSAPPRPRSPALKEAFHLSVEQDLPLDIVLTDSKGQDVTLDMKDSPSKPQFWVEAFEESANQAKLICRLQVEVNVPLVEAVSFKWRPHPQAESPLTVVGFRTKVFSEKNYGILELKNRLRSGDFSVLEQGLTKFKDALCKPETLLDFLLLMKFFISEYSEQVVSVFLAHFDLTDFMLQHIIRDYSPQRLHGVTHFLECLLNASTASAFVESTATLLANLQFMKPTKNGLEFFFDFLSNKLLAWEALPEPCRKRVLSELLDLYKLSLDSMAQLDSREMRLFRMLDAPTLFQPLVDFSLLNMSSQSSSAVPAKPQKKSETDKQPGPVQPETGSSSMTELGRVLRFESGLSRRDHLQKGMLLARKYDNFQEFFFLASEETELMHLWGWLRYSGPVFCFALRLECFNAVTGHFEQIASKFFDEDFVHSAVVSKQTGFGLSVPDTGRVSRLFRVKVSLNHLPSITYIEGLHQAAFDFEFGSDPEAKPVKSPEYIQQIFEGEFSKLTEQFNYSLEKGRIHDVYTLQKSDHVHAQSTVEAAPSDSEAPAKAEEPSSELQTDAAEFKALLSIRSEAYEALNKMELGQENFDGIKKQLNELGKKYLEQTKKIGEQTSEFHPTVTKTPENMSFWLTCIDKLDASLLAHCQNWTLEDKGEPFLTDLFYLLLERLLVPKHSSDLKLFEKLALTVSAESKNSILKRLVESYIKLNSEVMFVAEYTKDTEFICVQLEVKKNSDWQSLQDFLLTRFFGDSPSERDSDDQALMMYSVALNQCLPSSGEELELSPAQISKTLRFTNSLLQRKMHNSGPKGLENVVTLTKSALKCLNQNIKAVDLETLKATIHLFIREGLGASLYEIFNVLISRFASKNLQNCLEYFDDIFQDLVSEKILFSEGAFSEDQKELLKFILFNLLKIQKQLHSHKPETPKPKKPVEKEAPIDRKSQILLKRETLNASTKGVKGRLEKRIEFLCELKDQKVEALTRWPKVFNLLVQVLTNGIIQSRAGQYDKVLKEILSGHSLDLQENLSRALLMPFRDSSKLIQTVDEFAEFSRRVVNLVTWAMDHQNIHTNPFWLKLALDLSDLLREFKEKKTDQGKLSVSLKAEQGWRLFKSGMSWLFREFHLCTGESFREVNGGRMNLFRLVFNCFSIVSETTNSQNESLLATMTGNFKAMEALGPLSQIRECFAQAVEWRLLNGHLKYQKFRNASGLTYTGLLKSFDKAYDAFLEKPHIAKLLIGMLVDRVETLYLHLLQKERQERIGLVRTYILENTGSFIEKHVQLVTTSEDLAREFVIEKRGLELVLNLLGKSFENRKREQGPKKRGFFARIMSALKREKKKTSKAKKKVEWDKDTAMLEEEFGKFIQFKQEDFSITNGANITDWQNNKNGRTNQIYTANFKYSRKEITLSFKMKKTVSLRLFKVGFNCSMVNQQYPVGPPEYVKLVLVRQDQRGNKSRVNLGLLDFVEDGGFVHYNTRVFYFNPFRFRGGADFGAKLDSLEWTSEFTHFELVIGRPQLNYYDGHSPYLNKKPFDMAQVMVNFISIQGADTAKVDFRSYFADCLKDSLYNLLAVLFNSDSLAGLLSQYLDSQVGRADGVFPLVAAHMDTFIEDFSIELSNFLLSVSSKDADMNRLIFSFLLKGLHEKPEFYELLEKMMVTGSLDYEFLFAFWQKGLDSKMNSKYFEVLSNVLMYHMVAARRSGRLVYFPVDRPFFDKLLQKYSELRFNYNIERTFIQAFYLLDVKLVLPEFDRPALLGALETKDTAAISAMEAKVDTGAVDELKTGIIVTLVDNILNEQNMNSLMLLGYAVIHVREAEDSVVSMGVLEKVESLMSQNMHFLECLLFLKFTLKNERIHRLLVENRTDEKLFGFLEKAFGEKEPEKKPSIDWLQVMKDPKVLNELLILIFTIYKTSPLKIQTLETKLFDLLKLNKTNSYFVQHVLLEFFNFENLKRVQFNYDASYAAKAESSEKARQVDETKPTGLRTLPTDSIDACKLDVLEAALPELVDQQTEKMLKTNAWKLVLRTSQDSEDFSSLVSEKLFGKNPLLIFVRMTRDPEKNYLGIFCPEGFRAQSGNNQSTGYVPCSDNCFLFYYTETENSIVAHYSQTQFSKNEKLIEFSGQGDMKMLTMLVDGSEKVMISMDQETQSLVDLYPLKCLSSDPEPELEFPYEESIACVEIFQMDLPEGDAGAKNKHFIERMTNEIKRKNAVDWIGSMLSQQYIFALQEEISLEKLCSVLGIRHPEEVGGRPVAESEKGLKLRDLEGAVLELPSSKKVNFVERKDFEENYNPVYPVFDIFCERGGIRFVLNTIISNDKIPFLKSNSGTLKNIKETFASILELENISGFSGSLIQNKDFLPAVFELFIAGEASSRKWMEWNMHVSALIFGRLAMILKNDPSDQTRDAFLERKVPKKLLDKLAELTGDICRAYVSDEDLHKTHAEEEDDIRETKEEPQNFKKEIKKRKGVGYDKEGTGKKWVVTEYLEKKKRKNQIVVELLRLFNNLFGKENAQGGPIDRHAGLYRTVAESCMLPILESAFKCSSLHEMGKDLELYKEYCNVVINISENSDLRDLMYRIPGNYQPPQLESLLSILGTQEKNTELFRTFAKDGGKDGDEKEQGKSIECAKIISETIERVKAQFPDLGQDAEKEAKIQELIENFDSLTVNEKYKLAVEGQQFGVVDLLLEGGNGKFDHHYKNTISSDTKVLQGAQVVRLAQEIADLTASLPRDSYNAIFVRADENRLDVMKSMIAGAEGTPYANGLFEYHLYLPSNYPAGPPKCNLETTGSGDVRFNPNLYSCGKVCLSLLGTWRGNASENWDPKISNLLQLLLSIQSVVMSEEVYFNEPGYEGEAGTVEGEKKNEGYSNIVRLCNIKYGMIRHMEKPVKGFEQVTRVHFYLKRDVIVKEVGTWVKMAEQRESTYSGLVMDHNSKYSNRFQNKKTAYLEDLKAEITKLENALKELASTYQIREIFSKRSKKKAKTKKKDDKEEQERREKAKQQQRKNLEEMMKKIDVAFEEEGAKREFDAEDATVTDRWSRYIGAMGIEAVRKQAKAKVVILGMNALGVEVAKNLTLGGLKQLTLADWRKLDITDSVGNFFAQGQEGQNRATAVVSKLSQLNYYVKLEAVDLSQETSAKGLLDSVDVLVVCEHYGPVTAAVVEEAKAKKVKLVSGETVGVYSRVFVDLGAEFEVNDKDGEEPVDLFVKDIEKNEVIVLAEGSKHNLMDGDYVLVTEVVEKEAAEGEDAKSINGTVHQVESMETNLRLKVANLEGRFLKYERGGKVRQMKVPFKMEFKGMDSLKEGPVDQLTWDQNLLIHDFEKMGSSQEVAKCFRVKDRLELAVKRPIDQVSYAEVAAALTEEERKDEDFLKKLRIFCANSFGRLPSMCAFLGGILSQEVIKAITSKFTPIKQLFCTDFEEVLSGDFLDPERVGSVLAEDQVKQLVKDSSDKYARLRFILGEETFARIREAKLFMIGSGAIGCELIKNYAMIGLGSTGKGRVILTDPDSIELSNLNRQFLFREKHIGQPKSLVAAKVVELMNPDYQKPYQGDTQAQSISSESGSRILARLDKICPQTEDIYDNDFFGTLDVCANALDNIKARVYMDQRCVRTHRPLVESGTLGPKGHVQVIVPKVTENYGQVQDANEEGSIPICTLKMFPEETIHCVEWAKDRFDSLFSQTVKSLQRVIEEYLAKKTLAKGVIELKVIKEAYKMFKKKPENLKDCLRFARLVFQKYFHNKIRQLMYVYPLDHITKEGKPFWSLPKRPPSPLEFDSSDKLHRGFVVSYARLMARVWGMDDLPLRQMDLDEALTGLDIPPFVPSDEKAKQMKKENEKEDDDKAEEAPAEVEETAKEEEEEQILREFEKLLGAQKDLEKVAESITAEVFEKDDDANGHIDFMFACGNLRAMNYKLEEMEWIKVKLKAGRIVPALATTTAAVSGLQTIEIIKILKGMKLEAYRNCFMNTAINIISLSEPGPVVKHQIHEDLSVTVWDQWTFEVRSDAMPTFEDFLAHVLETYKLEVRDVLKGNKPVFLSALHKKEDFAKKKLDDVLEIKEGDTSPLNLICVKTGEEEIVENVPIFIVKFLKQNK